MGNGAGRGIGGYMNLPKMYRLRQNFDNTSVTDIPKTVQAELHKLSWNKIQPGHSVAIAAGSRGIANIA